MVPDRWWREAKARDYELLFGRKQSPVEVKSEKINK